MTDDGSHHLDGKLMRRLSSVLVTPLAPPFNGRMWFLDTNEEGRKKTLAVTREEGRKVQALFDGKLKGEKVMLERCGDKLKISLVDR